MSGNCSNVDWNQRRNEYSRRNCNGCCKKEKEQSSKCGELPQIRNPIKEPRLVGLAMPINYEHQTARISHYLSLEARIIKILAIASSHFQEIFLRELAVASLSQETSLRQSQFMKV